MALGLAFFGFLALAVDHSLGSTRGPARIPAPSPNPAYFARPLSTPGPPTFSAVKPPPNDCELFVGAVTFPPGVASDGGQSLVLGVLMGTYETQFVWKVPPAQRERLEQLLNSCIVLERGVDHRIVWPCFSCAW
jgi:hypothetical protein